MKRATGLGGLFFKANDPKAMYEWYEKHLGVQSEPGGSGAMFHWRDAAEPDKTGFTVWAIFPQDTQYFCAQHRTLHDELPCGESRRPAASLERGRSRHRSQGRRIRLRKVCLDHRPGRQQGRVVGTATTTIAVRTSKKGGRFRGPPFYTRNTGGTLLRPTAENKTPIGTTETEGIRHSVFHLDLARSIGHEVQIAALAGILRGSWWAGQSGRAAPAR